MEYPFSEVDLRGELARQNKNYSLYRRPGSIDLRVEGRDAVTSSFRHYTPSQPSSTAHWPGRAAGSKPTSFPMFWFHVIFFEGSGHSEFHSGAKVHGEREPSHASQKSSKNCSTARKLSRS